MGTSPMGVLQLLDSSQVTVSKQNGCFTRKYYVSTDQGGVLKIKSRGSKSFHVKDSKGDLVAEFRHHIPWFKASTMEVKLSHSPAVTIRLKSPTSRSTLIMDEYDQQVLRIKHTRSFWSGKEYKIMGREGIEVGSIRKDWSDYDLLYPQDLDARYKIALIATIVFNEIIEQRDATASSS